MYYIHNNFFKRCVRLIEYTVLLQDIEMNNYKLLITIMNSF
jgi:hypothetical protein